MVRHGETDWNSIGKFQGRSDIPLNSNGTLQAEQCRQFLKNSQWDLIITSPLKRAKQTAEIINKDLNVPLIEMDEFLERNYGDAEGLTINERLSAFPTKNYPNQEQRDSLKKRVIKGIEKVNQLHNRKKILLVSHGAVINTILAMFSNNKIGSGKTKLINACISNIEFVEEKWNIKDYNQVNHLSQFS